jgi:hypothetical protein
VLGAAKLWQDLFLQLFGVGRCLSVWPAFSYVNQFMGFSVSLCVPLILIIVSQCYDFPLDLPLVQLHPASSPD